MRSKELLILYIFLLIVTIVTMVQLWKLNQRPREIGPCDYSEIKEGGILRMITEYNQSEYFTSDDTAQDFQHELSQVVAKLSGLEVQTRLEMSLAGSFEGLSDNKCGTTTRNIPITSEMWENYLFIEPTVLNKQVLVQRTAETDNGQAPIHNQLGLAQKALYILRDSLALLRLQNLGHKVSDTIYVMEDESYSTEQLMIMIVKGGTDCAVCDQQIAHMTQKKLPEADILMDTSFTQLRSWAVRKDSPVLLDSPNSWFWQIRDSGLYNQIYKCYYK